MREKKAKKCEHDGAAPVAYFWRGDGGVGDPAYLVFYCGECDDWFVEQGAHLRKKDDD